MICECMSHKRLAWAWLFFMIGNAIPRMSADNQCSSRFVVSVPKRKCACNGRLRGFILTKKYIQVMIISSNTPNTKRASCITILWSIMSCSRQNTQSNPPSPLSETWSLRPPAEEHLFTQLTIYTLLSFWNWFDSIRCVIRIHLGIHKKSKILVGGSQALGLA